MKLDMDPNWRTWLVNDELYAPCGEGWRDILHDLLAEIHDVLKDHSGARVTVLQIKEKFAGLRFYWQDENVMRVQQRQLFELYRRAQERSYRTCETCGRAGELRKRGSWFSTRCQDHLP